MTACTRGCDASCNSDCGCGSTHHHCGCPCHTALESDEAAYARNERVMLAAAAEVERLKAVVSGKPPKVDELAQMRAVIEAMRPIVEAAIEWYGTEDNRTSPTRATNLRSATANNHARLGIAMAAWENSQTLTAEEKRLVAPGILSTAEWSALFEARHWAEGKQEIPLTDAERGYLASGIKKLTDVAYANREVPV